MQYGQEEEIGRRIHCAGRLVAAQLLSRVRALRRASLWVRRCSCCWPEGDCAGVGIPQLMAGLPADSFLDSPVSVSLQGKSTASAEMAPG